jgi:hypothetical protein
MDTRNKLSIIVREFESAGTSAIKPYSSEYLNQAIDYAYEHGFPLDFYVNDSIVDKNAFVKAIAENVEFDQIQFDNRDSVVDNQEYKDL